VDAARLAQRHNGSFEAATGFRSPRRAQWPIRGPKGRRRVAEAGEGTILAWLSTADFRYIVARCVRILERPTDGQTDPSAHQPRTLVRRERPQTWTDE